MNQNVKSSERKPPKHSNNNKKKGCLFLALPFIGTPLLILIYVFVQNLLNTNSNNPVTPEDFTATPETGTLVLGKVLSVFFLLAGLFCIIVAPILGIIYLTKKRNESKNEEKE